MSENKIYECVAQKKTKQNALFLVGDEVEFLLDNSTYYITKIYPRKNELVRPRVSNIDQLVIVIAKTPEPDLMLVDKLIIFANSKKIDTLLILNKSDLVNETYTQNIISQYKNVVDNILVMSAKQKIGIEQLKNYLEGKLSVFAGQSAVGKSTILNTLGLNQEIGELSKKSERGKNTTRQTEIFVLNKTTLITDTPGFSLLNMFPIEPKKLHEYYTDFNEFKNNCKYRACNHVQILESECAVKQAVTSGKLSKERYNRYVEHYEEIKKRWEERYD